jgi:hypothetical protein
MSATHCEETFEDHQLCASSCPLLSLDYCRTIAHSPDQTMMLGSKIHTAKARTLALGTQLLLPAQSPPLMTAAGTFTLFTADPATTCASLMHAFFFRRRKGKSLSKF